MTQTTILIPVYKQLPQFLANLDTNLRFLPDCRFVIVNDDPATSIKSAVLEVFVRHGMSPAFLEVIENKVNLGFANAVNIGLESVRSEYVMLLNSDVSLGDMTYLEALSKMESDTSIFAVGFAQREKNGNIVGRNSIYFKNGLFHHKGLPAFEADVSQKFLETSWVECGAGIFRMRYMRMLGGLDDKFSPFYWEDVDLGYRARERGWSMYLYNGCVVNHHHETSINAAYHKSRVLDIAYRNQEYFTQKHAKGRQKAEFMLHKIKHGIKKSFGGES